MAHKPWETWMKITFASIIILSETIADFTTECQRPCDCRWQSGNKAAICSNSSLKVIPANLSSDIQILDLSNNNLLQLKQETFKKVGLNNLKKLFIRDCSIETVHKSAFMTLAIMIELDLSKNKIQFLHPDTFRGTEKLRLINLNNNLIDKLEDGLFRSLKFLQKVEVSNNRIVRIGTKAFVNLPQLKILRIDGNKLSHMKPETLAALNNLSGLDLHNNPWRCDCNLQPFRDWVINHNLYTPPTACSEPESVQDKLWNELDSSNFACRPTILEPMPDATFKSYEENVTLSCKVVGNPTPDVLWRFNGKPIETRAFSEIRYSVNENTMDLIRWVNLTIAQVRYSDRGNYTCVAENPGGRDEKTLILVLSKYGSGLIAGMDTDSFAIMVGSILAVIIIFGSVLALYHFTSQNNNSKRLIKTDSRSTNGDVLLDGSETSENDKGLKVEINPVTKPPRKYEASPSLKSETTGMSELNKTLLDNESVLDTSKNNTRRPSVDITKIQKDLLMDRITQENQTYPPDLLSFPLRDINQISPANSLNQERIKSNHLISNSPNISPNYGNIPFNQNLFSRQTPTTSQGSALFNRGSYVTLPRRPKINWIQDQDTFNNRNNVVNNQDYFNMKLYYNGGNYHSLNKSEMDLGVMSKLSSHFLGSDELEAAPSPAPGTPHSTLPRNSLSSPNIHNQLMALHSMSMNSKNRSLRPSEQRALRVTFIENENLLRNSSRDLRINCGMNFVSDTFGRSRTIPKPPPKPRKKKACDLKEPFMLNSCEPATQV